jgi:hypothetical protein
MIPEYIYGGDTLTFSHNTPNYNPSYTLTYNLVKEDVHLSISDVNGNRAFNVDTSSWDDGEYRYQVTVTDDNTITTIEEGIFIVRPSFKGTDPKDHRTHNEKMLQAIKDVLEGKATHDQESYTIAGRSLTRYSWEELLLVKTQYEKNIVVERKRKGYNNTIGVTF